MCLQERCGVEQQHIGPYLEGRGGPPLMATDEPQGTFLKETQQWITEEEQVSCLHIALVSLNLPTKVCMHSSVACAKQTNGSNCFTLWKVQAVLSLCYKICFYF